MGDDVACNIDLILTMKKKQFLANTRNKQSFINLLSGALKNLPDVKVKHSKGDADYDIVMATYDLSTRPTVVVSNGTDVSILLLHYFLQHRLAEVRINTSSKTIHINTMQSLIGNKMVQKLFFLGMTPRRGHMIQRFMTLGMKLCALYTIVPQFRIWILSCLHD